MLRRLEGDDLPSLKDILEAVSVPWPVALTIMVASIAILIGDHFRLLYLSGLPQWIPGTAFLTLVLSFSILTTHVVRAVFDLISEPYRKKRTEKWRKEHIAGLDDLSDNEAYLLAWAVANRTRIFSGPYFNPHTQALKAKGYLIIPGGNHHTSQMPFEIPEYIWKALKEELSGQDLQELEGDRPFDRW